MELWQLRYFVAVAEERSITRAAARLHLTQPPLTAQVARLEAEIGVPLLVRHRRGVDLTEAGVALLERARRLLADVDDVADVVRGVGLGHAGRLALAAVPSAPWTVLPPVLARLAHLVPGVEVGVHEAGPHEVVERVRTAAADAGVVVLPPGGTRAAPVDPSLDLAVVHREPLVAVLPDAVAAHVLGAGERVDLAALRGERFLLPRRHPRPGLHAHVVNACRAAGFTPSGTESGQVSTVLALVATGLGVSLLPASAAARVADGARAVPLRQATPPVETAIVWRRARRPPPVLAAFLRAALSTPEPDVLGPGHERPGPVPD